ncbi:hypothetical protein AX17_005567 [Amanita inopinata Kibby_2008]|nr:hypothetical protein AX17_005567 [Amanita inopinata Kibby_2008]
MEGQRLLSELPNGNFTVFVPTDQAFATLNQTNMTAGSDPETLANIIAYHILPGNFTLPNATSSTGGNETSNATLISAMFPNTTVGRTLLDNSSFVQLEGNKSQVLAWTILPSNQSNASTPTILNQVVQGQNVSVVNETAIENLLIAFINGVLIPPGNLSSVLSQNNLSLTSIVLNGTAAPDPTFTTSTNITFLDSLEEQHGYTLFAPNNKAFARAGRDITDLVSNRTALETVIQNHLINATTVYSQQLLNTSVNFTSAAGQPFTFLSNSSGNFVTVGMVNATNRTATAQIVQSDVLVSNGVVHVIDRLLLDVMSDEQAASSAFASASSAATLSTSATGPIGGVPISSTSLTSFSSATSSFASFTSSSETTASATTAARRKRFADARA